MTQVKKVTVPDLGNFRDVAIIEINVAIGDTIKPEDTLITLESDKASMEIPSSDTGVIKAIHVKVGDKVSQGDLIFDLEANDANTAAPIESTTESRAETKAEAKAESSIEPAPKVASQPIAQEKTAAVASTSSNLYSSPSVRRLAREWGVDLTRVIGSGRKGRVMANDVQQYVKAQLQSGGNGSSGLGFSLPSMPAIDFSQWGEVEQQELSRINKLSASYLHRNWVSIPHVTQFDEADITEMEAFRKQQGAMAEKEGVKLTPLVFLMKAAVAALKQFPRFNASLAPDGATLYVKKYYHIGVAVDTPSGLVVPVVRDVDQKGLFDLAKELAEISAKARAGKLTAAEMQGSCFSISSLGGIGGTAFTPIINAPDVAILGVSKSQIKPVYQHEQFVPRLLLPLSLSYDHRVIDGALAARFISYYSSVLADIRRLLL